MDVAALLRITAPYQDGSNDMVFEVYTRGLAEPGHDAPFHAMESVLQMLQRPNILLSSGYGGAAYMATMANLTKGRTPIMPIPHPCHTRTRTHREECKDQPCTHDLQCPYNEAMWLTPKAQAKLRYAADLSDTMAEHLIQEYLRDARDIRAQLHQLLLTHGDIIMKRWKKMSREKRGVLLHETAAPLSFPEWPLEFEKCGDCPEDHFPSWPGADWFNAKNLSEDWTKLILALHFRTVYPEKDWAVFDIKQTRFGWEDPKAPLWYNSRCVVMHGDGYGKLCDFEENLMHCFAIVGFPRAFLTIQSQHQIMFSLRDIVKRIINGAEGTGNAMRQSAVPNGLNVAGREGMLVGCYYHQALVQPATLDPVAMLDKAESRFNMIKDEIWLMQTDPPYMQHIIQSKRIVFSNKFSGLTRKEDQLWHVGVVLLLEIAVRFESWRAIVIRCQRLVEVWKQDRQNCSPGSYLPAQVSIRLATLLKEVDITMKALTENFESIIHSTKATKRGVQPQTPYHIMVDEVGTYDFSIPADRLRWYIHYARAYSKDVKKPLPGLLPTLDQLFETEYFATGNAELVDKPTHDHLCDLQVLDELHMDLIWSQHASSSDPEYLRKGLHVLNQAKKEDEVATQAAKSQNRQVPDHDGTARASMKKVGALLLELMEAPWPKGRKDLAWHAKATETRKRLRNVWALMAELHQKVWAETGLEPGKASSSFSTVCEMHLEPSFLAELEEERRQCEAESARLEALEEGKARDQPQHVQQSVWGDSSVQAPVQRKQTKAKAIRDAESAAEGLEGLSLKDATLQEPNDSSQQGASEKIAVKKESLAVLRKMFPSSNDGIDLKGDIRWQVFLQAMKDAGMTAAEASGSAVSFSNAAGSICFHRPHPDPVIDPVMLHNMARRMNKWFGWDSATFVLRT